jgi:hypothetical protein
MHILLLIIICLALAIQLSPSPATPSGLEQKMSLHDTGQFQIHKFETSFTTAYVLINNVSLPLLSSTTLARIEFAKTWQTQQKTSWPCKFNHLPKHYRLIHSTPASHTRRRRHTAVPTRSSTRRTRRRGWRSRAVFRRWRRRRTSTVRRRSGLCHLALVVIGVLLLLGLSSGRTGSSVSCHHCRETTVVCVWVLGRVLGVVGRPCGVELLLLRGHCCGGRLSSGGDCGRRRLCATTVGRRSLRAIASAI